MTTIDQLNNLKEYVIENAKAYPALKENFYDLFCICQDKIADGGSPKYEIYLCIEDIKQLIEEYNNEKNNHP
jgi:hypothetical protein